MDVIIRPFWIFLSVVYFGLAEIHYKMGFRVTPSTYIAAAYTPAPDNPHLQTIFRQFLRDLKQDRKLLKLASVGFFVGGVVSLLQGLNLDPEIPINVVNVVFVVLAVIIVFFLIYWRARWIIWVFIGPVRSFWFKRKYKLKSTKQKSHWDHIRGR
jgi:hypothetical protein